MNQKVMVKWFLWIVLSWISTGSSKIDSTTDGMSKKLSENTASSGGQSKPNWTTNDPADNTTFDTMCAEIYVGNTSLIAEDDTNSTLSNLCKRCNGNITSAVSNCSLSEQNITENKHDIPCLDTEPCMTMSEEKRTTWHEKVTTRQEEVMKRQEEIIRRQEELTTRPEQLTTTQAQGTTQQEQVMKSIEQTTSQQEQITTKGEQVTKSAEQMSTSLEELTTTEQHVMTSLDEFTSLLKIDPCSFQGTCSFTASMKHQFCSCDEYCSIYNDCCVDTDKIHNSSKYTPYMNCYKGTSAQNYEGYFAVDSCPDTHDNKTEQLWCEEGNVIRHGPSVIGLDGVVFKNQFCAACHGIRTVRFFHITFYIERVAALEDALKGMVNLSRTEKLEFMLTSAEYHEIEPSHTTLRKCIVSTSKNKYEQCKTYINPVYIMTRGGNSDIYRNYFCVEEIKRPSLKCLGLAYDKIAIGNRWSVFPMTIMFAFTSQKIDKTDDTCDIWSQKLDDEGRCLEKERVSNFKLILQDIILVANKPLQSHYVNMIPELFALSQEIGKWCVLEELFYVGVTNTTVLLLRTEFMILTTMFKNEKEILYQRLINMQWKMSIFDEILGYETIVIKHVKERLPSRTWSIEMFDIYENMTGKRTDELQKSPRHTLDYVHVAFDRNKNVCDSAIVLVRRTNGTEVRITCDDHPTVTNVASFIKTITTYVCFSVSVLALFLLIILYRKLGLASSIPGSNLENISISLVLSKLLFMVGIGLSDIRELCYVIGVLLHYLWLSTFYFMSVSVMCIVVALTKMQSNTHNRQDSIKRKKRCLTVVGVFFPLLCVSPSVLLDVYGDEYFSAGYGFGPCFPNHFPSNLMFFSGPVMLSIAINCISLMKVFCTIHRLSREIGNISRSTPFTNAKVYIRILILSGLFWSIGILTAFLDEEWIEFLFTILCGLQGFFIALASLTTKKVVRDLRQLATQSTVTTTANEDI